MSNIPFDGLDNDRDRHADDKMLRDADSVVMGVSAYELTGGALAGVGDVNDDGAADVLVGSNYWDGATADAGAAFLFLGG